MNQHLEDRLRAYASSDAYAFHMPGHKRVLRNLAAEGADLYSYDITEIDGFDNLHDPKEILAEEMALAAKLYGVRETYFLVGGSTLGILAAVSSAVPVGGHILIERGCHISVYHAAHLRRLRVSYIEDPWNPPSEPAGTGRPSKEKSNAAMSRRNAENSMRTAETTEGFPPRASETAQGFPPRDSETAEGFPTKTSEAAEGFSPRASETAEGFSPRASETAEGFPPKASKAAEGFSPRASETAEGFPLKASEAAEGFSLKEPGTVAGQSGDETCPAFDAIVLTSPTYEGAMRPVAAWAAFARQMNAVLIIDEAHGAHLPFHSYFPSSATANGADLVVQSLHKTLPALTQTALLHNVSGRVDGRRIQTFLDIYETSSPSYLLLASITATLHGLGKTEEERAELRADSRGLAEEAGKMGDGISGGSLLGVFDESPDQAAARGNLMESYARRLQKLRARLSRLRNFRLFGGEEGIAGEGEFSGIPAGTSLDPGKLVILCRGSMDGPGLYRTLREIFLLQPEMCGPDYVLCMTSAADTAEGFERLAAALEELDRHEQIIQKERAADGEAGRSEREKVENSLSGRPLPPVACPIFEAAESEAEYIPLREAAGRISTGYVLLYPPDAPLIVPGEVFTDEKIVEIRRWREKGFSVPGIDAQNRVAVKI